MPVQIEQKFSMWTIGVALVAIGISWGGMKMQLDAHAESVGKNQNETSKLSSLVTDLSVQAARSEERYKAVNEKLDRVITVLDRVEAKIQQKP